MDTKITNFILSYEGNNADNHSIDFYDVARALVGFQRTLAITTHLVLNGEVITQAPSLKGAQIVVTPPEEGSWKILAGISLLGTALYNIGTVPTDTPLGHIVSSAYDYVLKENYGFHVDYNKTLGQLYERHQKEHPDTKLPVVKQSQLDSVVEKCEAAVQEMHRPIIYSKTAYQARITTDIQDEEHDAGHILDRETFEYMRFTEITTLREEMIGYISSYNSNTFKGRIYIPDLKRPIPFILGDVARSTRVIGLVTRSLHMNAQDRMTLGSSVCCAVFRSLSRNGRLKGFTVVDVQLEK